MEREALISALREVIEPLLQAERMTLVDIQWSRRGRRWVLGLFLEKEGGITLDDCARMSYQVGACVEVENLIDHAYTLEVSSPGLDRPLRTVAEYERFRGQLVRITTTMPIDGRSTLVGRLQEVDGTTIVVDVKRAGRLTIPLAQIKQARLEVEF
jgi:ribosome maturation factor RimP